MLIIIMEVCLEGHVVVVIVVVFIVVVVVIVTAMLIIITKVCLEGHTAEASIMEMARYAPPQPVTDALQIH